MSMFLALLPTFFSIVALCLIGAGGYNKNALTLAAVCAMVLFLVAESKGTIILAINSAALGGLLVYIGSILLLHLKNKKAKQKAN